MNKNRVRFNGRNFVLDDGTVITPDTMAEWYNNVVDYLDRLLEEHASKDIK